MEELKSIIISYAETSSHLGYYDIARRTDDMFGIAENMTKIHQAFNELQDEGVISLDGDGKWRLVAKK